MVALVGRIGLCARALACWLCVCVHGIGTCSHLLLNVYLYLQQALPLPTHFTDGHQTQCTWLIIMCNFVYKICTCDISAFLLGVLTLACVTLYTSFIVSVTADHSGTLLMILFSAEWMSLFRSENYALQKQKY